MSLSADLSRQFTEALSTATIGKKVVFRFHGINSPLKVTFTFHNGWIIEQTIPPGTPIEFTKGEDGHLKGLEITELPFEGLS